ncbi:unnamed protein product [Linum trigynum]|uniref:Tify domain-containing protein n=1 Tax=Linum trigynum TaxID=586398 RepID=A0AAV2ENG2_9ROSI
MSSQGMNFWVTRDADSQPKGEIAITGFDDNASAGRSKQKRGHQWVTDSCQPEHLDNKRLATEAVNSKPALKNVPTYGSAFPWPNVSEFQLLSGQPGGRDFGSEALVSGSVADQNQPSVGNGSMYVRTMGFGGQRVRDSSMGLSLTHNIEDHSGSTGLGGLRKVKVSQVTDSISVSTTFNKSDGGGSMTLPPAYSNCTENDVSVERIFSKTDGNFVSPMGHYFNQGNGYSMPMTYGCSNQESENILSMGQPFNKAGTRFNQMGPAYGKKDNALMSMASLEHEGSILMSPNHAKPNENFISTVHSNWKRDDNLVSIYPSYGNSSIKSMDPTPGIAESGIPCLGHNYNHNALDNAVSFGAFSVTEMTASSATVGGGYGMLIPGQSSGQTSAKILSQKNLEQQSTCREADDAPNANLAGDSAIMNRKPKEKKDAMNNFPTNVKSLLSTGILDGISVKYVSWSRETIVKGTIKGTGYLCGCNECNYGKSVNAFEFERHANCKTKHPNNHIYFDNGKTIYGVVQELKNTPQEQLFDVVQTVTGSQINQKNFLSWKASFQAAARELQRIYGKDEVVQF